VVRQTVLLGVPLAVVIVCVSAMSAQAAHPGTRICGQLAGPHASYLSRVSGMKSHGSTWTILSTGVSCSAASAAAPPLLSQWAKAQLGARLSLKGYTCSKLIDTGYSGTGTSSGGVLCHQGSTPAASIFAPSTFAVRETAPYTVAQIKAFFGLS
jgi:hypothetical protein